MVIYDVYEELEKPDKGEILYISNVLNGKVGIYSYDGMGEIFHTSCTNKSDNSDVIINGVTCENVASLNMGDKFQLENEDYKHRYNQSLLSKEKDVNDVTKILLVPFSLASYFESLEWQDDPKIIQQTLQFSRERSYFHNNVKMFYLSITTLILFGYILLTSTLLMLLIYLQMLKKKNSVKTRGRVAFNPGRMMWNMIISTTSF